MSVNLSLFAGAAWQFFDNNGVPLAGGLIYTYAAGTTTPTVTYTSANGVTPHSNPIVLDAAGRVPGGEIWVTVGLTYKFILKNASGVQIGSYDNIPSYLTMDSANVIYNEGSVGAVNTTVQAKLRQVVSPQDFGAVGNGTNDDTSALEDFFAAIAGTDKPIGDLGDNYIYLFSELDIPANIKLRGRSILSCNGSSPTSLYNVTFNGNVEAEYLNFITVGTESNFDFMLMGGNNYIINNLTLKCSVERTQKGGIRSTGSNVYINYLETKNIARPFDVGGFDPVTDPTISNVQLGSVYIDTYIRGLKFVNVVNWSVKYASIKGKHSASTYTPGHVGILIFQTTDWNIGEMYVEDSGEHGFRIGGTTVPSMITERGNIDYYYSRNTGATGFKINPAQTAPSFGAKNISVGQIVVIDAGQAGVISVGNPEGNQDGLRITDAQDIYIGSFVNIAVNSTYSSNHSINLNSCDNIVIDSVYSKNTFGNMLRIDKNIDATARNFSGLYISSFVGQSSSSSIINIEYQDGARTIGNVCISNINVSGSYNYLLSTSEPIIQSGQIYLNGLLRGAAPNLDLNTGATITCDFIFENKKYFGNATTLISLSAFSYLAQVTSFDNGATVTNRASYYVDAATETPTLNAYGGSYGFSRVGSGRRGAAIALKQTGANQYNTGIGFFVSGSTSIVGSDSVTESMLLRHTGTLYLGNLDTYANNANAIAGGLVAGDLYKTSSGEVRIVI